MAKPRHKRDISIYIYDYKPHFMTTYPFSDTQMVPYDV